MAWPERIFLQGNLPENELPKASGVTQRPLGGVKAGQDTHFMDPQEEIIRFPSVDT